MKEGKLTMIHHSIRASKKIERRMVLVGMVRGVIGFLLVRPADARSQPTSFTPSSGNSEDDHNLLAAVIASDRPRIVRRARPYRLAQPLAVPGDTNVVIEPDTRFLWTGAADAGGGLVGVFEADGDNVTIEVEGGGSASVECSVPSPSVYAALMRGKRGFAVLGLHAIECQHVYVGASTEEWDRIETQGMKANAARDVRIVGGGARYTIPQLQGNGACYLQYVIGCTVRGSRYDNVPHGVQWWGGNADSTRGQRQGVVGNERKCRDLSITDVSVHRAGGGGIWGSMGKAVMVRDCVIDGAGDVGFDAEGSVGVTFENCTARNARNGCFTTFFLCESVRFVSCVGVVDNKAFPLVRIYNDSLSSADNKGIEIVGGRFECRDPSGPSTIDTVMGPVQDLTICGVSLRNVRIDLAFHNMHRTRVLDNRLVLPYSISDIAAIRVGSSKSLPSPRGPIQGSTVVSGNQIDYLARSADMGPAAKGPTAIVVYEDDFNSSARGLVANNVISGAFADGITLENASANNGIVPSFNLIGNQFRGLARAASLLVVRRATGKSHEPTVHWDDAQTRDGQKVSLRQALR